MRKVFLFFVLAFTYHECYCWGFYAHQKINYYAVFLLPPAMLLFYKPNITYIMEHAVDPDKRRYSFAAEGARHYIDMDHYGRDAYKELPEKWQPAVQKYTEDSLLTHGIVPWWIQTMMQRLTTAFKEKDPARILKLSAEIGHYIADSHVPLHACSNYNGQKTGQNGIHAFWESRIPELLADKEWDFWIGKAEFIEKPADFVWRRVYESARASDTVLSAEKKLTADFPADKKYAFEERNGILIRQYSSSFCTSYNTLLKGMIERRMRASIYATASLWFTAWVNAGQPDLKGLAVKEYSEADLRELNDLNYNWKNSVLKGRPCD